MNLFKRFIGHTKTVMKHRREVRKLCFKCGLYWQGLTHDLSKYSPTEFWNGVKFYTGTKSPHCGEREKHGYSKAWIHHHNHNKHHAEYWQDIVGGKSGCVKMPKKYLAEMICDRVAACKVYLKDNYTKDAALNYYNSKKDENQFHVVTRNGLEFFLTMLTVDGEDDTFEFLRLWVKNNLNI